MIYAVGAIVARLKRLLPGGWTGPSAEESSQLSGSLANTGFHTTVTQSKGLTTAADGRSSEPMSSGDRSSGEGSSGQASSGEAPSEPGSSGDLDVTDVEKPADIALKLGLTEAEFVIEFLEAHDGKVDQQAFVDQLDWSNSKVSRLLQSLEDDGQLVRIMKGRENVVYTPECAPCDDPFARRTGSDESGADTSTAVTPGTGESQ